MVQPTRPTNFRVRIGTTRAEGLGKPGTVAGKPSDHKDSRGARKPRLPNGHIHGSRLPQSFAPKARVS